MVDVIVPPFDVHSYYVIGLVVFVVVKLVYGVCCIVSGFNVEVVVKASGCSVCDAFCFDGINDGVKASASVDAK